MPHARHFLDEFILESETRHMGWLVAFWIEVRLMRYVRIVLHSMVNIVSSVDKMLIADLAALESRIGWLTLVYPGERHSSAC